MKSIAIIGGGAAGCFCAIELKRRMPESKVTIYESQDRLLAKVAITGGGRCNLTNSFKDFRDANGNITSLEHVYPRGHRLIKRLFNVFSPEDTVKWFESHGRPDIVNAGTAAQRKQVIKNLPKTDPIL